LTSQHDILYSPYCTTGGFIAIPWLHGWVKLSQHQAHSTSLGTVFATGTAGAVGYAASGHVDWVAAGAMTVAGVIFSAAGARFQKLLNPSTLKRTMGILMITIAPVVAFKDQLLPHAAVADVPPAAEPTAERAVSSVPPKQTLARQFTKVATESLNIKVAPQYDAAVVQAVRMAGIGAISKCTRNINNRKNDNSSVTVLQQPCSIHLCHLLYADLYAAQLVVSPFACH
jgi:Sulfite exporter TauE/SafE